MRTRSTVSNNETKQHRKNDISEIKPSINKQPIKTKKITDNKKRTKTPKQKSPCDEIVQDIEDIAASSVAKKAKWQPLNWMELLESVRKMREKKDAPADTMGCHIIDDGVESLKDQRFQVLISLLLSSQTKDQITFAACGRLREHGFTAELLKETKEEIVAKLLYPVSFYKTKAKNLIAVAKICHEQYDGDIPHSIDDLCKLPGIGPKMAYLAMDSAWNETVGIGVDTHVHRLAQRWQWLPKGKSKNPEDTRQQLESWLPSELWRELNWLLVGFGQTVCTPLRPKCGDCAANKICPSAFKK